MNKRDSTKIHIANVRLALVGTSIPMCANIFYIFMYFKQTNEQMNEEVEVNTEYRGTALSALIDVHTSHDTY